MAKVYTAQEMRIRATLEKNVWGNITTAEMLRQAADALEREEEREKKYEFSAKNDEGLICTTHFSDIDTVKNACDNQACLRVVRRPVGEWEEVCDGE